MSVQTKPQTEPPALALTDVRSGYEQATVLRGVSLRVPPSSVVALLGANGAGKTTLLKTIAGFIEASDGKIAMEGVPLTGLKPHVRRRRGLCYIPEGRGIFRSLSVRENLALQAPSGNERRAVELAVEAFPALASRMSQLAGTLSGGEQQMLAMAQAYVVQPRVLLVDEASLGLAPKIVDAIFEFLVSVNQRGTAVLLVDQFVSRALQLASYAYVLRQGEIVHAGPAAEIDESDIVEQYLGDGTGQQG
ncbi:ABC transporter ATP-binding protein [Amycolatopsis sp. GM8]|uniref:ABC transporter ATP-binding protein n=1 Tax=Amycolatopsis sp. GM8 TaxID=2896530 RepID=UPI001F1D7E7C|nr:ABC transporter ATP-binding protein [Amycolatopsis sp. GM8]